MLPSFMPKYKLIIFDLDNTLEEWIPEEKTVEEEISHMINKRHPEISPEEFQKVFDKVKMAHVRIRQEPYNLGRAPWFEETFRQLGIENEHIPFYVKTYWEKILSLVRLFHGTEEVLTELRKKYKLVIFSDSDGNRNIKMERIEKLGLKKYFDKIYTSDDARVNKPHRVGFKMIAHEMGVRYEECIMVGDNPIADHKGSSMLGMLNIWQKQGVPDEHSNKHYDYIDHEINDIKELPSLLEKIDP